jgi:hypothetical protein
MKKCLLASFLYMFIVCACDNGDSAQTDTDEPTGTGGTDTGNSNDTVSPGTDDTGQGTTEGSDTQDTVSTSDPSSDGKCQDSCRIKRFHAALSFAFL